MTGGFVFFIFIVTVFSMLAYARHAAGSLFNVFVLFAGPYAVLVPLNQLIAAPFFGMYYISDSVILMLNGAIFAFFLGSMPMLKRIEVAKLDIDEMFDAYFMKGMTAIVLLVSILALGRVAFSIATGTFDVGRFDESTEAFDDGIIGHLRLVGYVLLPIVATWAMKERRPMAIVAVVLMLLATFATFKKNYIFCMLVSLVIFTGIYRKQSVKSMLVALVALIPVVFFANYFIGFFVRGLSGNVAEGFYLNRFFVYTTGSLVYDNYIFDMGIRTDVSLVEKCLVFLFALPNMFFGRLFGVKYFEHVRQPFLPVCDSGQTGNVVDAIGYMYPSQGGLADIACFLVFFVILGFVFTALVNYLLERNVGRFSPFAAIFLSEFVFFSFFGTFYINPTPWETLVLAAVIPWLMRRSTWAGLGVDKYASMHNRQRGGGRHASGGYDNVPRVA